jgi:hypothetical protein
MGKLLAADFRKLKRKMIWFLVFLGPLGVVGLQAVNFGLRYDWLTKQYQEDLWGGLIQNVGFLTIPALLLGIALIASMVANIEHATNAWKQTLALPVGKAGVFVAKFVVVALLLACSTALLLAGTIILGLALGFGSDVPLGGLLKMAVYPYLAALPLVAVQVWLSVTFTNQAVPLTIGIMGTAVSIWPSDYSIFILWQWPWLINPWEEPLASAALGIAVGLLILAAGCRDFVRRDVK